MIAEEVKNKRWTIKVGHNSNGMPDLRQTIYDSFNNKLDKLGLGVALTQSGIMGADSGEVLVEVSAPEDGSTYYGLATDDDVERVINSHIIGGRIIPELVVPTARIDNISLKNNETGSEDLTKIKIDIPQWQEAMNLLGMGWFLIVCIMGGLGIGFWLDNIWNTRPLFLLIGLALGMAASILGVYRTVSAIIKKG
jgi:F0F1-type ATP synthase assembly protein I/(2Fe-2S) ferredoxin